MQTRGSGSATRATRCLLPFLLIVAAAMTSPATASDEIPPDSRCHAGGNPAVRTRSPLASAAMEYGLKRSATLEALVTALQDTDVIAYVDSDLKPLGDIWGHVGFISKTPQCRYVRIAITARVNLSQAAALLGHELQHVLEIAAHPEVVDEVSLARMYEQYGHRSRYENSYDSEQAVETGVRVAAELLGGTPSVRSSPTETER